MSMNSYYTSTLINNMPRLGTRAPCRSCTCLLVDLLNISFRLLVVPHTNTVKIPITIHESKRLSPMSHCSDRPHQPNETYLVTTISIIIIIIYYYTTTNINFFFGMTTRFQKLSACVSLLVCLLLVSLHLQRSVVSHTQTEPRRPKADNNNANNRTTRHGQQQEPEQQPEQ